MAVKFVAFFLFAHLCVFCLCDDASTRLPSKGYMRIPQVHGWLKLHKNPDNWLSAKISCNLEGAALVLPWTGEFTSAVNNLQRMAGFSSVYSGVHITHTAYYEGLYGYTKGEPTMLVEPNHSRLKLCGVFNANSTMSEVNCKERLPFICYVPDINDTESEPAPATPEFHEPRGCCDDKGYEYSEKTGHWYKFHAERTMTWTEARTACENEGARLAVPNSDDEAKVLIGLYSRYLDKEIVNTDFPDWVSVGVLWESGAWKTVDGQTLGASGYETWKRGWPGKNGNYVVMDRGGRYSNTENVFYPYVCEKIAVM